MGRQWTNHFSFQPYPVHVLHNEKAINNCITSTVSVWQICHKTRFHLWPDAAPRCCSTILAPSTRLKRRPCIIRLRTSAHRNSSVSLDSASATILANSLRPLTKSHCRHRQHPIWRLVVMYALELHVSYHGLADSKSIPAAFVSRRQSKFAQGTGYARYPRTVLKVPRPLSYRVILLWRTVRKSVSLTYNAQTGREKPSCCSESNVYFLA